MHLLIITNLHTLYEAIRPGETIQMLGQIALVPTPRGTNLADGLPAHASKPFERMVQMATMATAGTPYKDSRHRLVA